MKATDLWIKEAKVDLERSEKTLLLELDEIKEIEAALDILRAQR
jgi:hypothetical protein